MGSRNAHTVPSATAAATQVRSIAAASSGRAGEAMTRPGTSRAPRRRCRCGSARRSPSGSRSRRSARRAGCGSGRWRRTPGWPPRRAAGPRRCAGRRGTGSPGSAASPDTPAPSARPRIDCSSSSVSNTRASRPCAGVRASRRRRRPWRDVLAEHEHTGSRGEQAAQRAVDRLGQRERAASGGGRRGAGASGRRRRSPAARAAGRRGASGGRAREPPRGRGRRGERHGPGPDRPRSGEHAVARAHAGCDEQAAVASSGSRARSAAIAGGPR